MLFRREYDERVFQSKSRNEHSNFSPLSATFFRNIK